MEDKVKVKFGRAKDSPDTLEKGKILLVETDEGFTLFTGGVSDNPIPLDATTRQDVIDIIGGVPPIKEVYFTSPSEEWLWIHELNLKPQVDVIVSGKKVYADIVYLDNDSLKVIHSKPQTGSIIIR